MAVFRACYATGWSARRDLGSKAEAIRAYVLRGGVARGRGRGGWRAGALAEPTLLDGSAPFDRLPPIDEWDWRCG